MKFIPLNFFITILGALVAQDSIGLASEPVELTPVQHYTRCKAMLALMPTTESDSLYQEVKSGAKTSDDACLALLRSAQVTFDSDDEGTVDLTNKAAKQVLNGLHRLHSSWFTNKEWFLIGNGQAMRGTMSMRDSTAPASYYTRALFDASGAFTLDKVLTYDQHLLPARAINYPGMDGMLAHDRKSAYSGGNLIGAWDDPSIFLPVGDLVGLTRRNQKTLAYTKKLNGSDTQKSTVTMKAHLGGGALGSSDYLLLNMRERVNYKPDGAVSVARKWAKAVLKDFLCRDIPVVTLEDAAPFVKTESAAAFRHSATCAACHTTIDRMTGVMRHVSLQTVNTTTPQIGGSFIKYHAVNQPTYSPVDGDGNPVTVVNEEDKWPLTPDAVFANRPRKGHFMYRNTQGQLIDVVVNSIPELGQKISEQKDFYMCVAYRYYKYFTGFNMSFEAIEDSQNIHAQRVKLLTNQLVSEKKPIKTIEAILTSDYFKKSDFGGEGKP